MFSSTCRAQRVKCHKYPGKCIGCALQQLGRSTAVQTKLRYIRENRVDDMADTTSVQRALSRDTDDMRVPVLADRRASLGRLVLQRQTADHHQIRLPKSVTKRLVRGIDDEFTRAAVLLEF